MTAAWLAAFPQGEETEIWQGNLFALDADALLSPANSFGDMSGGLDRAIDAFYAGAAQPRLLAAIQERFVGRWRLPVSVRG